MNFLRTGKSFAIPLGAIFAGAAFLLLRSTGSVALLHVGYSEDDYYGQIPFFCLTNGTSKPIAYAGDTSGEPFWGVETARYIDPFAVTWMGGGLKLRVCVLQPGQCVVFQGWPSSPGAWGAGVTYFNCKGRNAQPATLGHASSEFSPSNGAIRTYPFFGSGVDPERTLPQRVKSKMPNFTPAWLMRYVDSKAGNRVAWGPVMVSGTYEAKPQRALRGPGGDPTSQYSWTRSWIERHTATNNIPEAQRVFVIRESRPRAAFILEHRSGMTLHDVLAQMQYRDSAPTVQVFRPTGPKESERLRSDSTKARSYLIHALDLVTIYGSEGQK